jgi:hypothetical protein
MALPTRSSADGQRHRKLHYIDSLALFAAGLRLLWVLLLLPLLLLLLLVLLLCLLLVLMMQDAAASPC